MAVEEDYYWVFCPKSNQAIIARIEEGEDGQVMFTISGTGPHSMEDKSIIEKVESPEGYERDQTNAVRPVATAKKL